MTAQAQLVDRRPEPNMDIPAMLAGAGITAASGFIGKALGFWKSAGVSEATMNERISQLKEEFTANEKLFREDSRETMKQMQSLLLMVTKLQASQDRVNETVSQTLVSLRDRISDQERSVLQASRAVSEIVAGQSLLREILQTLKEQHPKVS